MAKGSIPVALIALLPLLGCRGSDPLLTYAPQPGPPHPDIPGVEAPEEVADQLPAATQAEFRRVDFGFDQDLVLHVDHLRGVMRGLNGGPVVFDDPTSFVMEIAEAEASMTARDLTALMQRYVFGYPGAPIRGLTVRPEAGGLRQAGILHKVIDIPFEMLGRASVTENGWIRISPIEMDISGLDGLGLMKAFGIELDDMIDLEGAPPGIRVEDNDFLLDPLAVLPPPRTTGRLLSVRTEDGALVQRFGPAEGDPVAAAPPPPAMPLPDAVNYMFFWGGVLHFGKLFMPQADMQVVDDSPEDPFDFFLDQYNFQLVAGFTRNRPDYGLEVHMVDYDELPPSAR
jgi:hypothetical protein